jgi:formylglycine-generating enzyme required for sulfatase activity
MKYEITQGQYAKFLNYLPSGYDYVRYPNKYDNARHTINLVNGNFIADAPDRACNWLAWLDISAYCDWAGLRPMTELEFEKICRGALFPIPNEYSWGDTILTHLDSYDGIDGSGTETAFPTNANCHSYYYRPTDTIRYGPARAGIFARAETTRHQAGAGYYGAMEMGGNVYEQVVTIGNPQGRAYVGCNGDGYLQPVQPTWPTSTGSGRRGGSFTDHNGINYDRRIRTSDREWAVSIPSSEIYSGGRGVRSAK